MADPAPISRVTHAPAYTPEGIPAEQLAKLKRLAARAIAEQAEPFALTAMSSARSTSRLKTRADRRADEARIEALCQALYIVGFGRTECDARMLLRAEALA